MQTITYFLYDFGHIFGRWSRVKVENVFLLLHILLHVKSNCDNGDSEIVWFHKNNHVVHNAIANAKLSLLQIMQDASSMWKQVIL